MPPPPEPSADEAVVLRGDVENVTYHDERSLFTVLRLSPEAGYRGPATGGLFAPGRVTAVGKVADPAEGTRVRLVGRWGDHPSHGTQFEFDLLEVLPPEDEAGLARYLASKTFPGVGETLAKRIVGKLGVDALDRIRADPACLEGVAGLRPKVAERLAETLREQEAQTSAHAFLARLGLGPLTAQAVVARLGVDCEERVRMNPYQLARVPTIGFRTADRVAQRLDVPLDDPRRLRAALRHALERATNEGHGLLPLGELLQRSQRLLDGAAPREAFVAALHEMEDDAGIVLDRAVLGSPEPFGDDVPCYLVGLHRAEVALATALARLAAEAAPPLASEEALAAAEQRMEIELHPDQRAAVLALLSAPVALLTGGPGVGKTTIVRLVADLAQAAGWEVALASPTGRAAKRLSEATGRPASTLHRLLRFRPEDATFEHGADKPLRTGLVVVDEVSMLDVALAHRLVDAIAPPTRLVLVGDPDQLPSVGPGNVLADLLASGAVPTSRLTRVYRQARESLIVTNAHRVLRGALPELPARGVRDADFYFFPVESGPDAITDRLVDVVTHRVPDAFGMDWSEDVQVLAPMYKGPCGVDVLNDRLREALDAPGGELVFDSRTWRVGDRVVQTRNDYEREVFNGDLGRVVRVDSSGIVTVRFPERDLAYEQSALGDLLPAFAMTVHRSQGGEFPGVVMPLTSQHAHMLQRNLFYTAITRAQRLVVLVGERAALRHAIENTRTSRRRSLLARRLG